MGAVLQASAKPAKRLFIDLLTRDIPLTAAFLDLVDNSVNAAVEPHAARLASAQGYLDVYSDETVTPQVDIELDVGIDAVRIRDDASGISAETAESHVFRFGRESEEQHPADRLSVYGIGLKRAIFKLGNRIKITSDHQDGGFNLDLNVAEWAKSTESDWTFMISTRPPCSPDATGTEIVVTELHDAVKRRLADGTFEGQLREAIAKTYEFYLAKFVRISLNGKAIAGVGVQIGSNKESQNLEVNGVTCVVSAGIGVPVGGQYRDKTAGWFVFCNGRAVIFADKSVLTGWGGAGLPIFQPKHRPFVGTVFFVSEDPEKLPWTTTKSGVNEDSVVWQVAKRKMSEVGRAVIAFLDSRYTDEGTSVDSKDLQEVSKTSEGVLVASTGREQKFKPPTPTADPKSIKVQYFALVSEIKAIAKYLGNPSMSGSDVGRYTFSHFLKNEVEDE